MHHPAQFGPWKTPAIYERGLPLWHHINAVMHLCFLGVVKSTTFLIADCLSRENKFTSFVRTV